MTTDLRQQVIDQILRIAQAAQDAGICGVMELLEEARLQHALKIQPLSEEELAEIIQDLGMHIPKGDKH